MCTDKGDVEVKTFTVWILFFVPERKKNSKISPMRFSCFLFVNLENHLFFPKFLKEQSDKIVVFLTHTQKGPSPRAGPSAIAIQTQSRITLMNKSYWYLAISCCHKMMKLLLKWWFCSSGYILSTAHRIYNITGSTHTWHKDLGQHEKFELATSRLAHLSHFRLNLEPSSWKLTQCVSSADLHKVGLTIIQQIPTEIAFLLLKEHLFDLQPCFHTWK